MKPKDELWQCNLIFCFVLRKKKSRIPSTGDLYIYLNKYHLDGYSSDFSDNGIKLKFYLKNGGALLYIPDMKRIKESNYKMYIKKSVFLEKNWYYTKE